MVRRIISKPLNPVIIDHNTSRRMRSSMTHQRRTKSHFPSLSKPVFHYFHLFQPLQKPRQVIREFGRLDNYFAGLSMTIATTLTNQELNGRTIVILKLNKVIIYKEVIVGCLQIVPWIGNIVSTVSSKQDKECEKVKGSEYSKIILVNQSNGIVAL